MDFSLVLNFFIAVLAILNPIGNIPIYLEHVNMDSNPVQENIAKLMAVAIFVLIIFFYFTGQPFLRMFGITIPAFRIAGGILIMMIGIRMLHGKPKFENESLQTSPTNIHPFAQAKRRISSIIVPVATPIFVGPGAITTVILYSQRAHGMLTNIGMIIALAIVCAIIGTVLYLSRFMFKVLGTNGMQIVSRCMGLILCAIAVQFVIDGFAQLLPGILNPLYTQGLS